MSKIMKERRQRIIDSVSRSKATHQESDLICPHCAHVQVDIWDGGFDLKPNGETNEGSCQRCESVFEYSVHQVYSTSQIKPKECQAV